MKTLLLTLVLLLAWPLSATNYYLATAAGGGNDSNNGTSTGTPWLSPNHAVNCGDIITASASTAYDHNNFVFGKWGTVTCAGGNNVAWLTCAAFDACKMSITIYDGFELDKSYWGIKGWEVDGSSSASQCFW